MSVNLYAGPAKIYLNSVGLYSEGQDGQISMVLNQDLDDVGSGATGLIAATTGNTEVAVDFTPTDNWGSIATLYPAWITTPVIGKIIGAQSADVVGKIWTTGGDGRLFTLESVLITKHPDLHLGAGKPLYGAAKISGILASSGSIGAAGAFYALSTGASDPGGHFTLADFIRERWTAAWGTAAGFGGDSGAALQAEEEFVISFKVTWQPLKVQKQTVGYRLVSVQVMIKFRPYGPTQAQIDAVLLAQESGGALGRRLGQSNAADFILTSAITGKTITVKNAEPYTAGYDFGGNKLGNGEMAFLGCATFTSGAYNPVIAFSS